MGHVRAVLTHLVAREAVYCTYRNKNFWLIEFSHGLDPKPPVANGGFRKVQSTRVLRGYYVKSGPCRHQRRVRFH